YVVDAGGQRFHVGRVDRGEHADTQLVAAQLPVRLCVHDPVRPQGGRYVVSGQRGGTVAVSPDVDRPDDLRTLRGIGDERVREGRLLRPCIQYGGRPRGPGRGPGQAALAEHPVDLVGQQEQGRHRGRVVGLVLGRVLQRDPQREEVGYVPAAR